MYVVENHRDAHLGDLRKNGALLRLIGLAHDLSARRWPAIIQHGHLSLIEREDRRPGIAHQRFQVIENQPQHRRQLQRRGDTTRDIQQRSQCLGAALDLLLHLGDVVFTLADIADDRQRVRLAQIGERAAMRLDREWRAIVADMQRCVTIRPSSAALCQEFGEMLVGRGVDELGAVPAYKVVGAVAMHTPGGGIRRDDDTIQIGDDDRVASRLEDATIARLHLIEALLGVFVVGHIGMPAGDAERPSVGVAAGGGARQHPAVAAIVMAQAMLHDQPLLRASGVSTKDCSSASTRSRSAGCTRAIHVCNVAGVSSRSSVAIPSISYQRGE